MGAGSISLYGNASRAPCPPATSLQVAPSLVGTAHDRPAAWKRCARAFAHPTAPHTPIGKRRAFTLTCLPTTIAPYPREDLHAAFAHLHRRRLRARFAGQCRKPRGAG